MTSLYSVPVLKDYHQYSQFGYVANRPLPLPGRRGFLGGTRGGWINKSQIRSFLFPWPINGTF